MILIMTNLCWFHLSLLVTIAYSDPLSSGILPDQVIKWWWQRATLYLLGFIYNNPCFHDSGFFMDPSVTFSFIWQSWLCIQNVFWSQGNFLLSKLIRIRHSQRRNLKFSKLIFALWGYWGELYIILFYPGR